MPISQLGKLRLGEINELAKNHRAKRQSYPLLLPTSRSVPQGGSGQEKAQGHHPVLLKLEEGSEHDLHTDHPECPQRQRSPR